MVGATDWARAIGAGLQTVREAGWDLTTGRRSSTRPTEPTGFPPPRDLSRPEAEPEQPFELLSGDRFSRRGNLLRGSGDIRFRYRGYDGFGQAVEGDVETERFTLTGNVDLVGSDRRLRGDLVRIDFRRESFDVVGGRARLSPSFVGGGLIGDLYLRGGSASGTERRVNGLDCDVTTCNLEEPHYHLSSGQVEVISGDRAILRNVAIVVLGRTLLRLPFLILPLREAPERYTPEVGQSPEEGYYVRSVWPTWLRGENSLLTRLDYFTKLGGGIGGDYRYAGAGVGGALALYGLTGGRATRRGNWEHRQRLLGGDLSLEANYQRENYLTSPDATTFASRAGYDFRRGLDATRLTYFRNESSAGTFRSVQESVGVADRRSLWGISTDATVSLSTNRTQSGDFSAVRRQVDVDFLGERDLRIVNAELRYRRAIPVGSVEDFFGSSDQTPLLTLRSDARRLLGQGWAERLPFTTDLSIGELSDTRRRNRLTRTGFNLALRNPRGGGRDDLDYTARFRQTLYSDGTAQWLLDARAGYGVPIGIGTLGLRYDYLRPHGFTPLQIDNTGRNHELNADLTLRPLGSLRLSAFTGYDFLAPGRDVTPWRKISVRSELDGRRGFTFRTQSTYDTGRRLWSNVRLDAGIDILGGRISAGARFDGQRHTWGAVNLFADGIRWGRLKTSALLNYNGYLKKFEARHFSFTYDLHCAEAILQVLDNPVGFRSGTQISLFIRLKALPFDTPFGLGRRGQGVGSGSGGFGF